MAEELGHLWGVGPHGQGAGQSRGGGLVTHGSGPRSQAVSGDGSPMAQELGSLWE